MDIISCDCEHAFQDKRLGVNKRYATVKVSGAKVCTVCGKATAVPEFNKRKK